ncbi:MAG TPA: hypothetical protein VIZ60_14165 [Rubrobacter sp.]
MALKPREVGGVLQFLCYRIIEESKISLFRSHLSLVSQIHVLLVAP